ncbi:amidohydrolase family protein [Sphaerisporangium rhizosphaerae]|uniref:Amidohydrolase family protein n=1 Tax=Sphaerisporangium rhizosphaerae TaxID=2269375 RepID=A0ABW2P9N9_9ACTN
MPSGTSNGVCPTVDVHAHVWLPEVHALADGRPALVAYEELERARLGPESARVSARRFDESRERLTDLGARAAAMSAAGVDAQVVSVAPHLYHPWAGPSLAWAIAQATNEGVATHCAGLPERLCGLGVAPIRHPEVALAALEDAVVRCGLRGVEITSHATDPGGGPPTELSDPRLEPLWRRAEELDAVIFLHPWGCSLDARLDRWYLSNSVGQPVEHAVALSHLIFSGVLDRHPALRFVAAHGGGYLPAFAGRLDHAWLVRPEARTCRHLPSCYLRRLYYDTVVHAPEALVALVRAVGVGRVLLGSDYPFDMGVEDPVRRVHEAVPDPVAANAIRGGNAADLSLLPATWPPG